MPSWEQLWTKALGVPDLPSTDLALAKAEQLAEELASPAPSVTLGNVLTLLAGERETRRILVVGSGVGYMSVCLLRGATAAGVLAIDADGELQRKSRTIYAEAGLEERVALLEGDALGVLPNLDTRFDLIYVDGDPAEYRRLLDCVLTRLEVGGVVAMHGVAPPTEKGPESAFCGYFLIHPQLDSVVLPVGDGLAIGRKTKPLVTDMGGPF